MKREESSLSSSALVLAAYAAVVFAVYYPSLWGYFLPIDDPFLLEQARRVLAGDVSPFAPLQGHRFRPAAGLYYTLLFALFGLDPFPYAVVRLLLAATAAFFVFLYCRRFWPEALSPFACGLLFALLYSHYEVNLWLTPSYLSLCIVFFLWTLLWFDRYLSGRKIGYGWPLAMMGAIAFHESALALPLLLPVAALTGPDRAPPQRWMAATLAALGLAGGFALFSWTSLDPQPPSYGVRTVLAFVIPFGEHASNFLGGSVLYPPYRRAIEGQAAARIIFPALRILILAQLCLLVYRGRKVRPPLRPFGFGLAVYLLSFAPPVVAYGEKYQISMRHIYTASLGSILLLVSVLSIFWQEHPRFWRVLALSTLLTITAANAVRLRFVQPLYLEPSRQLAMLVDTAQACCSAPTKRLAVFSPAPLGDEELSGGISLLLRLRGLPIERLDILPMEALRPYIPVCEAGARRVYCWPEREGE